MNISVSDSSRPSRFFPFGALALLAAAVVLAAGCSAERKSSTDKRVIVLGIDGMDYELTQRLLAEGQLPNLAKLAAAGGFQPLETSVSPQSPVAWSDFITGQDSGGHGIFDFIHRKPRTMIPYLSTSEPEESDTAPWQFGDDCQVPSPFAGGGGFNLLRKGEAFWELLEERGIPAHIIRMPANFPPTGKATRELSGMGTPDIVGTYGTFHFYTSKLFAFANQDVGGGEVHEIWPEDGVLNAQLYGPPNPFRVESEKGTADFTVYLDPDEERVKIEVGGEELILDAGQWSGWVPVEIEYSMCSTPIPGQTVHAQVRFYLRSVRPELEFYVSPLNYDPLAADIPLSTPASFAAELAEMTGGRYYTQGMPEDTNSLREEVLTIAEFLAQAKIAGEEFMHQYDVLLDDFLQDPAGGLFFYYFGNIDQISHMMWHTLDPDHPSYDAERDAPYADLIPSLYRQADKVIGETLAKKDDDTTLVVMSDHGFTSWRRSFDLNSWLEKNGYLVLKGPHLDHDPGFFLNVDLSKTRAYGIGIGGMYVNMKGRERTGIVNPGDRDALLDEIAEKLLAVVDPVTGGNAVTKVYHRERTFKDRGAIDIGPDMIIGYAKRTKLSNVSSTGGVGNDVFTDNLSTWTGDHIMDHESVPGVLFFDRPLKKEAPRLKDLAAAILAEFGIEDFPRTQTAAAGAAAENTLAQR